MQLQQHTEEQGLLGSLCPGQKKLEGKTFYLDSVKKRPTALLLEAISFLGGGVESFLHKDVSFVVTGSQDYLKEQKSTDTTAGTKGRSEEAQRPIMTRETVLRNDKRQPGTPRPMACGSRGKALLEKAIRNNERLQKNSVLANARSWGVKILYVDDVLLYLKLLTQESFSTTHKRSERTYSKQQGSHVVKAAPLRSPYLKIEDLSRKYKPLHMQSMTFPALYYLGRFSPFESPPPPHFDKQTEQGEKKARDKKKVPSSIQDKSQTPFSCNPSPWRPRKKDLSYCECCHQPFTNLGEHLQSDQHRAFVLDLSNYSAVDQLVAEMLPGFNPDPPQQLEETLNRPPTPLLIEDACELEHLTDVETEHAVQALQRQRSSFSAHLSSPTRGPLSCGPASPSPGVPFTITNLDPPPAAIQPFPTDTDSHPRASSPAMPVLDVEPQAHNSTQLPDLSPCPDLPCPSPDPYSMPPVLSPQVPYINELYCPHSDPPVLSPQQYTAGEAVERHIGGTDTAESAFQSIPADTAYISSPLFPSVALTNTKEEKGLNQESVFGFGGIICSTSGFECGSLFSRRSCSLSQPSATAVNPKKRCRSASPKHSWGKRRRTLLGFCSGSWSKEDKVSCRMKQSCSYPQTSSVCPVETLDSKQTFTMFCVPTVPSLMDRLGHGSTSATDQPLFSKTKTFDLALQFPNDKSCSAFSSQDTQCSHSHSTSVCIESALIPDLAMLSSSSSDSDWDCELLSRLGPTSATPLLPTEQGCELDKELLHRPCTWTHNSSYESRLHTALQPSTPATSLCGEERDPSAFSRTVVQIVEVQH